MSNNMQCVGYHLQRPDRNDWPLCLPVTVARGSRRISIKATGKAIF
jgi:hypothetical protein